MMVIWIPVLFVVSLFIAATIAPFVRQNSLQGCGEEIVVYRHQY